MIRFNVSTEGTVCPFPRERDVSEQAGSTFYVALGKSFLFANIT